MRSACGKVAFASFASADKVNKISRRRRDGLHRRVVYRCPECNVWHLGNEYRPLGDRLTLDGRLKRFRLN